MAKISLKIPILFFIGRYTIAILLLIDQVRWWDSNQQASPYSEIASFQTGLWSLSDWKGQWIGGFNQLRNGIPK